VSSLTPQVSDYYVIIVIVRINEIAFGMVLIIEGVLLKKSMLTFMPLKCRNGLISYVLSKDLEIS